MCAPEGFHYWLNHVKQRLIIVLDHNIRNGLDPCPSDIILLRELYNVYDNGAVDTYSDSEIRIDVIQKSLFSLEENDELPKAGTNDSQK
jgi:hypothetical protein